MAYRLSIDAGPTESLRRTAREELDDAVAQLSERFGDEPVEAVHEARKDVKKTRALLRLARSGLGTKAYRRENGALRDAAGHLSGTRDNDVMIATVEKLAEHGVGRVPESAFTTLRDRFATAAEASRNGSGGDGVVATAESELRAVAARIEAWPLERCTWATVVGDATRAYERGRRELARAEKAPTVEQLHAWRKRVKDLWYHQRLLAEAWPEVLEAQAEAAHVLSELLGDDHDLAVLAERLQEEGGAAAGLIEGDEVRDLVEHRRLQLQDAAFRLGRRIYAEPVTAFSARLEHYVDAAAEEGALAGRA